MGSTQVLTELFSRLAEPFTGEALFDCLADSVFFIKNQRGEYAVVNHAAVLRCGLRTKGELIGRKADEVYPPPLGKSYREQDEEILRTGKPILNRLELQIYPGGRPGWCLTTKLPLKGADGAIVGLAGISQDLHVAYDQGDDYDHVAEAVCHIQTCFDQPLKVRELAAMAGLSEYQFEQRIRKIFHLTAGQLIQKVRMDAAVHRLRNTDDPIVAIALACGYAEQSSFSRQFKRTVGLSPAEYRHTWRHPQEATEVPPVRRTT
jgi:AraC-like DNA-binding protein